MRIHYAFIMHFIMKIRYRINYIRKMITTKMPYAYGVDIEDLKLLKLNSVFSVDNHVISNVERIEFQHVRLNNIVLNPIFTYMAIKKLKIHSAGGPDGIFRNPR